MNKLTHPNLAEKKHYLDLIKEISQYPKVAFLDTETTDLDGELIEIAILTLDDEILVNELVKPVVNFISQEAYDVHKISLEELQYKNYFYHHIPKLEKIFSEYHIVIYNSKFDFNILENSLKKQSLIETEILELENLPTEFKIKSSCLMDYSAIIIGEPSSKPYHTTGYRTWKLADACQKINIDISNIANHRALGDCIKARKLFLELEKMVLDE